MPRLRACALAALLAVLATAAIPQAASAAPRNVLTCHDGQTAFQTNVTGGLDEAASCTIDAPSAGKLVVFASASMGLAAGGAPFEAFTSIVFANEFLPGTKRLVDVTTDGGDGADKAYATARVVDVAAGAHTVMLGMRKGGGTGPVAAYQPAISAIFVPTGSSVQVCGAPVFAGSVIASTTPVAVASCTVTASKPSRLLVLASASVGPAAGANPFEVLSTLRVNGTDVVGSQRWQNVYTDLGDGTDRTTATSSATPIGAGTSTAELRMQLVPDSDPMKFLDPVIVAIAVPDDDRVRACGQQAAFPSHALATFVGGAACTLVGAQPGRLLAASTAWLGGTAGDYELNAQLTVGGLGVTPSLRWVDVALDGGDGTDESLATQAGLPITSAGDIPVALQTRVSAGVGTAYPGRQGVWALAIPTPDLTAPVVSFGAVPPTAADGTVAWTVDDPGATTTCSLDGAAAAPCTSPYAYAGLSGGGHTLEVTATDDIGNVGAPATRAWTVAPPAPAPTTPTATTPPAVTPPLAAPKLSKVTIRPASVRRTKGRVVLRFTLSRAAKVKLAFRRGTRTVASRTLTGRAGANAVTLTARTGRVRLRAGRYTLVLTPAGGRPASVRLTVRR